MVIGNTKDARHPYRIISFHTKGAIPSCTNVSGRTVDTIPQFKNDSDDTTDEIPLYDSVSNSATNKISQSTSTGNGCLSSKVETNFEFFGNEKEAMNIGHSFGQRHDNRGSLRKMSKEQKISLLKAYLKGNQSKAGVLKPIRQISETARTRHSMEQVWWFRVLLNIWVLCMDSHNSKPLCWFRNGRIRHKQYLQKKSYTCIKDSILLCVWY